MRYTEEQFDALLKRSITLAIQEEWDGEHLEMPMPLSASSNKKMQQLLSGKHTKTDKDTARRFVFLRCVAAAVFATLLLGGAVFANPSARAYLQNLVKSWFPDHVQYDITGTTVQRTPESFEIGYIPEGYTLESETHKENKTSYYVFTNGDNSVLNIGISASNGTNFQDNEHNKQYQVVVSEQVIDVYESEDGDWPSSVVLYLQDENIMMTVSGYLSVDELVDILVAIQ